MKYFYLFIYLLSANWIVAQPWVSKDYTYDSVLNVVYGVSDNFLNSPDTLEMDIYVPNCGDMSPKPLLLFIHGGAFLAGTKDDASIVSLCKSFAKRGYVTATINYRLGFVSDDNMWSCNYPNYPCIFAQDSAEWIRAYYRGVQDAKGAIRYLVNRQNLYKIDTDNIFLAGESAGAFIAMGASLLDDAAERMPQTYPLSSLNLPHTQTYSCVYNQGNTFPSGSISRPDLGGIEGSIELGSSNYTIKGIGNFYGGMLNNLLALQDNLHPKPAIYSFHQPCDIVVPIDSARVFWGLSWCMANGYNCYGIAHTPKVYGSRAISNWNQTQNYGYTIQNEFTSTNFPYSFLFGTGSCADQVNNPCHAYDNKPLRENNLANFFAPLVTSSICSAVSLETTTLGMGKFHPNPAGSEIYWEKSAPVSHFKLFDMQGKILLEGETSEGKLSVDFLPAGIYGLQVEGWAQPAKFVKGN